MSIFVDAAKIITRLSSLGSQIHGVIGRQPTDESLAANVISMSAGALASVASVGFAYRGPLLRKALGPRQFGKLASRTAQPAHTQAAAAASVILWTITAVGVLELMIGFGPPDDGADLRAGSAASEKLSEHLASAAPDESWQGAGSKAYADLNATLQNTAVALARLDTELAVLVQDQAAWVTHMRLGLGVVKDVLLAAFVIEIVMTVLPCPAGPVPARIFGLTASALGITAATGMLATVCYFSFENAHQANALTARYDDLMPGTEQAGSLAQSKVAASSESSVSNVDAISASMSGGAALSGVAGSPPVAVLAQAGGSQNNHAVPSAPGDTADTAVDAAAQLPPSGAVSTLTMPTLAQVQTVSRQPAKQLSDHPTLRNHALRPLQQLTQQGQPAAGPALPAAGAAPAHRAPLHPAARDTHSITAERGR